MDLKKLTFLILLISFFKYCFAQQQNSINWISFEQLEDSLNVKPKKVFIDFYADWCTYCKKMDKVTYKNPEVINVLNTEYYAVKMNAESKDTIGFGKDIFTNKQYGKKRNPIHEIPLLLASRKNVPFSLPAIVILDQNFKISNRFFEYLSSKKMIEILKL